MIHMRQVNMYKCIIIHIISLVNVRICVYEYIYIYIDICIRMNIYNVFALEQI